jgi:hypothetical protein
MPINQVVDIGYKIVEILREKGYNLYGLDEVITSSRSIKNMYRFYINIPNSTIKLHFMFCPDQPEVTAGLSNARKTGIWIGLIDEALVDEFLKAKNGEKSVFDNIQKILKFNFKKFEICDRCYFASFNKAGGASK